MAAKPPTEREAFVRDEAIDIPDGETTYSVLLDHQTVEQLSTGTCPDALRQRMYDLLAWQRDALRAYERET